MIAVEKAREWANKILKRQREIQEDEVSAEMMQHMERRQALQEEVREFRESEKRKEEQRKAYKEENREVVERYNALKGDPAKAHERSILWKRHSELNRLLNPIAPRHPVNAKSQEDKLVKECRDVDLQQKYEKARAKFRAANRADTDAFRANLNASVSKDKADELRIEALGRIAVDYGKEGEQWERYTDRDGKTWVRGKGKDPLHESTISHCNSGLLAQSNRLMEGVRYVSTDALQDRSDKLNRAMKAVREELIWSEV